MDFLSDRAQSLDSTVWNQLLPLLENGAYLPSFEYLYRVVVHNLHSGIDEEFKTEARQIIGKLIFLTLGSYCRVLGNESENIEYITAHIQELFNDILSRGNLTETNMDELFSLFLHYCDSLSSKFPKLEPIYFVIRSYLDSKYPKFYKPRN